MLTRLGSFAPRSSGVVQQAVRSFGSSPGPAQRLTGQDVLSAKQFDRELIEYTCSLAAKMRDAHQLYGGVPLLQSKVMGSLAFEPSTRTFSSFNTAMMRLGGNVLPLNPQTSSAVKGETLEDTIRVMENYCDVMVIRHPVVGSAQKAADYSSVPVLNAGDGQGEHPTQALLDIYTMQQELGKVDGLTITLLGDLKYGRTVHSLVQLLAHFDNVTINYLAPDALAMPQEIVDSLKSKKNLTQNKVKSVEEVIKDTDILYVTRIQKERFADEASYLALKGSYVISPDTLKNAKKKMAVMHPLPRVDELSPLLDSDPRAAYFRTVRNGLHLRMALLAAVMGKGV